MKHKLRIICTSNNSQAETQVIFEICQYSYALTVFAGFSIPGVAVNGPYKNSWGREVLFRDHFEKYFGN